MIRQAVIGQGRDRVEMLERGGTGINYEKEAI